MSLQIFNSYTLRFLRYSPGKIFKLKVTTARSKSNQGHTTTLHTCIPQPITNVSPTCILWFLRYNPDKILKVKVTAAVSEEKSRSHHDVAHLQTPTSVPTPYQVSTSYALQFLRYSLDKILKVKVTARSNQGNIMTLHTYTPNQCPYNLQLPTPYGF